MTANQRRPGFRLPWSSEEGEPGAESESGAPPEGPEPTPTTPESAAAEGPAASPEPEKPVASSPEPAQAAQADPAAMPQAETEPPPAEQPVAAQPVAAQPAEEKPASEHEASATAAEGDGGSDFMRDLVSAMRRVAEEARDAGLSDLRGRADEQVRLLESDAERRRGELRARADADVDAVGEWAKTEAERITKEAEQRVVERRAQLEQQLAGDTQRTEAETKALRDRVTEYERELEAYHGQLGGINDPAAFAAAAKRMPAAPELTATAATPQKASAPAVTTDAPADAPATAASPAQAPVEAPVEPSASGSNGVPAPAAPVHPAEEEVLAARLAELDATLPAAGTEAAAPAATEPVITEVVVKGLGSFGAITGFRQALSGVAGIDAVALSLGQTGEFVFRATHVAGFDVRGAIASLEGDAAKIEDRPEGGLRVTLERAR